MSTIPAMSGEELVSPSVDRLIERHADGVLADLQRAHARALAENPEGSKVIAEALRQATLLGVRAQCRLEGRSGAQLEGDRPRAWDEWRRARDQTPESREWPVELRATVPDVVDRAGQLVASAGTELGLRGRAGRELHRLGAQCAEAGGALARSLSQPPLAEEEPAEAEPAPVGAIQPDGSVRVALAANQAEAELLQGMLQTAGIPSSWRRTGGDLPHLLSAGYREIYVPESAADEAQALLATLEAEPEQPEPATRRIGLERTGVRLIGKATAAATALSILLAAAIALVSDLPALGLAGLGVLVIAIAAIVAWSERP